MTLLPAIRYSRLKPSKVYDSGKLDGELQRIEGALKHPRSTADSIPTVGAFTKGDFVENSSPAVLGGGGSQYTILGWKRLTTGIAHVLNTDWVEARTLTGT